MSVLMPSKHDFLLNSNIVSIVVNPEEFFEFFRDIRFRRTSFNTGEIFGKTIECPTLTQEDCKRDIINSMQRIETLLKPKRWWRRK